MNRPKKPKQYQNYKNAGGKSTVRRFELEKDGISVVFTNNTAYRWTNQSAGPANVSKMKELAVAGKGLDTFIKASVKDSYLKKIR